MKKNSRGDTKWIPRHMGSKLTFIYPWIKNSIHLILLRREKFVPAWMFSWSWFWKPTSEFRPSELVKAPSNIWIFRREKNFLTEFFFISGSFDCILLFDVPQISMGVQIWGLGPRKSHFGAQNSKVTYFFSWEPALWTLMSQERVVMWSQKKHKWKVLSKKNHEVKKKHYNFRL